MSVMFSSGGFGPLLTGSSLSGTAGTGIRNGGELFRNAQRTESVQGSQKTREVPEKTCRTVRKTAGENFGGSQCAGGTLAGSYGGSTSPEEEFALIREQLNSACGNSLPLPGLEVYLNTALPGGPAGLPLLFSAGTMLLLSEVLLREQYAAASRGEYTLLLPDPLQAESLYADNYVIPLWLILFNQLSRLRKSVLEKKALKEKQKRKESADAENADDEEEAEAAPGGSRSRSLEQALEDMAFMFGSSTLP